jgi:uncharacterized protein YdaU (DUF1376 family)
MHYYTYNIADYRKDTSHLSIVEHGIYRALIDWYYLDERPIPSETQVVMRRLRLGSSEEATSLQNVLSDFFELREDGWHQARCDAELALYRARNERNKINGKAGGRPKKTQVVSVGNPKQTKGQPKKTLTNNHKPITNIGENPSPDGEGQKKPRDKPADLPLNDPDAQLGLAGIAGAGDGAGEGAGNTDPPAGQPAGTNPPGDAEPTGDDPIPVAAVKRPNDVTTQTWADWLALRKKKSAPPSQTVLEMAVKEAKKAGLPLEDFFRIWCLRGTQGLEAAWLTPQERQSVARPTVPVETFRERDERLLREKWAEMAGRKGPDDLPIDVVPTVLRLAK